MPTALQLLAPTDACIAQLEEMEKVYERHVKELEKAEAVAALKKEIKYQQLKQFLWHRDETPGLSRCARMVGRKLYVCTPLFGAYLAGMLPEQNTIVASANRRDDK